MADTRDDLLQQLNELQAVHGIDTETRKVIGALSETIVTLGDEIDDLRQRVAELEDIVDGYDRVEDEQQKQAWYSER